MINLKLIYKILGSLLFIESVMLLMCSERPSPSP